MILNFGSMFIVMPYLTSNSAIFGIYSLCMSLNFFIVYADLGFISAGQKYAAEYYAKDDTNSVHRVIGFSVFTLFIILILLAGLFTYLGLNPEKLINNLNEGYDTNVASSLLITLAIFTPLSVLQRWLQILFAIRMEGYLVQRNNIIANLLKLLAVLWFFRSGKYDIVGYFIFSQAADFSASIGTYVVAHYRYKLNFSEILRSFRFSGEVFRKMKKLAMVVVYLNFCFILYYECDALVIGRLFGAKQAGIYAIGLTILYFLRTVFGILFAPFSIKFNHYIGLGDSEGLKLYLMNILVNLTPFIVIPIITLTIFTKPIILSWVGIGYSESIEITQCLIFLYVFSFIFFPMSFLLNALERLKELYLINTLLPLLYWILIAVTFSEIGLLSFAISKVIVFAVSSVIYYSMMIKYLNISLIESVKKIISPIVPSTIYTIIISNFLLEFMPVEKSNINLLITTTFIGLVLISSFILMYIVSKDFKRSICKAYNLIGVNGQHNVDKSVT